MHFFVTGASGFVGSVLCNDLVSANHKVTGATRFSINIPGVQTHKINNWQDVSEWRKALTGVDVVFHLAARVHIMHDTAEDPLFEFRQANLENTKALAKGAVEAGIKKFIFLSSIHVNGTETHRQAFTEEMGPSPEDPYAVSKAEAERFLRGFFKDSGVELIIVRPPLVYGPGCGGNFLKLLKVVRKVPVLPFGGFDNLRSMIYVGNLSDFLFKVAVSNPKATLYLISDGEDLSFGELILDLAQVMPKSGKVIYVPKLLIRLMMLCIGKSEEYHKLGSELRVDPSKALKDFQWKPRYSTQEGLKQTINWYLNNLKN